MKKNPFELDQKVFEAAVREVVAGSQTKEEAIGKLREAFSPVPLFWVEKRGDGFSVLIQQHLGGPNRSINC